MCKGLLLVGVIHMCKGHSCVGVMCGRDIHVWQSLTSGKGIHK